MNPELRSKVAIKHSFLAREFIPSLRLMTSATARPSPNEWTIFGKLIQRVSNDIRIALVFHGVIAGRNVSGRGAHQNDAWRRELSFVKGIFHALSFLKTLLFLGTPWIVENRN